MTLIYNIQVLIYVEIDMKNVDLCNFCSRIISLHFSNTNLQIRTTQLGSRIRMSKINNQSIGLCILHQVSLQFPHSCFEHTAGFRPFISKQLKHISGYQMNKIKKSVLLRDIYRFNVVRIISK